INKVAAGYPADFTDLDYPASIADDYISCPDLNDPDAFAARVVGDSMTPTYLEGDIVIFSPKLALQTPPPDVTTSTSHPSSLPGRRSVASSLPSGIDCFVRLERDNQTTFKRIYFEPDGSTIRLQPLNNAYPPRTVHRNDITGLYPAAYVMRKIHR
ncbi:MAG: S24 family peptidase, partial [Phycisphaerales bacterium]|nr:S24 family peptidase [Phycisphaerales bacterium]